MACATAGSWAAWPSSSSSRWQAEGVLWPAERRIQAALGSAAEGAPEAAATGREATLMVRAASAAVVLLLLGTVLMIAQP